jgi:glycosyltransferase involved in cell wall biosynthesis
MKRALRILHVPDLVGGNAPALARAERDLGLESVCAAYAPSAFGYEPDVILRPAGVGRLRFEGRRMRLLWQALSAFDVIHFNFGRSMLPHPFAFRELRLLRARGKHIVVTYQGDDARQGAESEVGSPIARFAPDYYTAKGDARKRRGIAAFDRWADAIHFLNPDLARALPDRARFLPYAHVDPRLWRPVHHENPVPVLVHAPSDRSAKGTRFILEAVETLRSEGLEFEFVLVEGIPQAEARRVYERADLLVDQLLVGWYGGVAVEAMALGVPVVAHIERADLDVLPRRLRDELPVIDAKPETIVDVLREWLGERRLELADVGRRSRAFAETHHDPILIASRLKSEYEQLVAVRRR